MSFVTRLVQRRVSLVLLNTAVTLVAIVAVEAADLNPLWVVVAALASGVGSIGVVGFPSDPGQARPEEDSPPPTVPSGSPPAATLPE
ncbi:MAG TPA: hypothetical protein VIM28_04300 [Solirubrobacterales bacterium]